MKKAGSHWELNPELLACAARALTDHELCQPDSHQPSQSSIHMYYTRQVVLKCLSHTPNHIKVRLCGRGATYSSTTHGTLCEVNCTRPKQSEILSEFSNHPLPTPNLLELYHLPRLLSGQMLYMHIPFCICIFVEQL